MSATRELLSERESYKNRCALLSMGGALDVYIYPGIGI